MLFPEAKFLSRRTLVSLACALLLAGGCRGPEPFEETSRSTALEASTFRAGVSTAVFTPEPGYPLGGFGGGARRDEFPFYLGLGWPGWLSLACHQWWHEEGSARRSDMLVGARGVHDDLSARALVLRPDQNGPPLALVRVDAIAMTAEIHEQVSSRVAELGFRPETVILAATHTHSGMGAYMRAPFASLAAMDNFRLELEERLVAACAEAIREASSSARPARLGFARARDRDASGQPVVAKNRRARRFELGVVSREDIDDEIGLLWVTERDTEQPIALLVNYAVHPTVLGPDNLHFSADLTGAVERSLSARLGGVPVLFINGAEGDVGPRRVKARGGLLRCRELGEAFGELVAPALEGVPTHARVRLDAVVGDKELGSPRTLVALGRERFLDGETGVAGWLSELFMLPLNLVLWSAGLTNLRLLLTWNAALGVVVQLDPYIERTRTRVGGLRLRAGEEDVALLCLPGEATHDVGLALRSSAERRGATRTFLLGLAQDHIGYIASRREYRRGSYEAWSTLFGQGTADEILGAENCVLDALGYPPSSNSSAQRRTR